MPLNPEDSHCGLQCTREKDALDGHGRENAQLSGDTFLFYDWTLDRRYYRIYDY